MASQKDSQNICIGENMDGDLPQFENKKMKSSTKGKIIQAMKSFKSSSEKICKVRYQKMNNEEKLHRCSKCDRGFESKTFLERHEKIHLCELLIVENWTNNAS